MIYTIIATAAITLTIQGIILDRKHQKEVFNLKKDNAVLRAENLSLEVKLSRKEQNNKFIGKLTGLLDKVIQDAFGHIPTEEKTLEQQLQDAIDREDYDEAHRIQDLINNQKQ